MGRNNADFHESVLYHGTVHPFQVGDVVEPREDHDGEKRAWATSDLGVAKDRAKDWVNYKWNDLSREGKNRSWSEHQKNTPPRVFRVEPLGDVEQHDSEDYKAVSSKKGFRVLGEHDGEK